MLVSSHREPVLPKRLTALERHGPFVMVTGNQRQSQKGTRLPDCGERGKTFSGIWRAAAARASSRIGKKFFRTAVNAEVQFQTKDERTMNLLLLLLEQPEARFDFTGGNLQTPKP